MIVRGRHTPRRVFCRKLRKLFIGYIADGWSEDYARRRCGISNNGYLKYKRETEQWIKELDEARDRGVLALEDEAHRRAKKGVSVPVVSGGRIITRKREYSDSLMLAALRARSPRYAAGQQSGASAEIALSGAAQILLDRLTALAEHAEKVERATLSGEIEGSPAPRRRKKAGD